MNDEMEVKTVFLTPDVDVHLFANACSEAGVITRAYFGLKQKRPLSESNAIGLHIGVKSVISSKDGDLFYTAPEQINAIFYGAKLDGVQDMHLEDLAEHLFGRRAADYWNPQRLVGKDIRLYFLERWNNLPRGFSYWDKPAWFDLDMQRDREELETRNSYWP